MFLRRVLPSLILAALAFGTALPAPASRRPPHRRGRLSAGAGDRAAGVKDGPRARAGEFERERLPRDPKKCKCQNTDAAKSDLCSGMLGYFCPDSTLRYLASSCMDLFGGATLCQCAENRQIQAFVKAEDAAQGQGRQEGRGQGQEARPARRSRRSSPQRSNSAISSEWWRAASA
jgi:hypothetical protein